MSRLRRGFTLVETVVTVGILAVLAAFLIPAVLQKSDTADPVKIANDLNAIGAAIQTFGSDLKGTYPSDLEDLTVPIQINDACVQANPCDSTITHADIYKAAQVTSQWRGPYLTISIDADTSSRVRTGYVGEIHTTLMRYDAVSGTPEFCTTNGVSVVCPFFDPMHQMFVALTLTGLDLTQARQVNALIDGPKERNPQFEGRFRYVQDGSIVYFLATPIPPTPRQDGPG
jgi:prepilin-type N-terminal cleavage/methylation domain-containing protein